MTKKSPRSRSTRSRRSPASQRSPTRAQQFLVIAAVVVVVILGACYLLTGADPLGLFSPPPGTPTVSSAPPVAPPTGGGGDWWKVYFTDPQNISDPEELRDSVPGKLIDYIDGAERSIHIAAFEFDLTPVAEALIAAEERGVEVQWVTDDEYGIEQDALEHRLFPRLRRAGANVKDDGRDALMHNKFWIFDGRIVWTGSTNVTVNGGFRNNNNVLVIESTELAAIYGREFDEMWAGQFGPTSPSTVDDQALTVDGTPVQVLFAAEDRVISRLLPLIQRAQSSIRFMAFSFTHDDLGDAVLARAEAGVDVRGIFETRGSETEYSEMPVLYCAKVPVRQDGNPGMLHHKVLVIDEQTVVTGSLNFSENADESNDENVVITTNADIAAQYLQEFDRRWAEAEEPDRTDMGCR